MGGTCYEDGLTENCQTSYQLETDNGSRRPGRPSTYWQQTVKVEIRGRGINWEQIPDLAVDRGAWRKMTTLCAISTGGTKV